MAANSQPAKPNEIYIARVYDAPVQAVWNAWTDPAQTAQWWGPRGFTLTTHSKDLKPGGHWHYTMHGPDGTDYPNKTKYFEVEKNACLIYDHGGNDEQAPLFRVTVHFREIQGKTHMEMTMALATAEAASETKKFIKKAGGNSTWDRLAEYLSKEISGKEQFVINRTFDATIGTLFDVWTDPQHFSKWSPPTGFTMELIRADIRPGGGSFYVMSDGDKIKMYGKTHYLEVRRPDHIVYTQEFCDENEKLSRHPMAPTWPATMLTRIELTSEGNDRTRATITWEVVGDYTPIELDTFVQGRSGMTQGWTGSLDKLEDYLANLR